MCLKIAEQIILAIVKKVKRMNCTVSSFCISSGSYNYVNCEHNSSLVFDVVLTIHINRFVPGVVKRPYFGRV